MEQQLEQVRLQNKLVFDEYQSQQKNKKFARPRYLPPETYMIMRDSILNSLTEDNLTGER